MSGEASQVTDGQASMNGWRANGNTGWARVTSVTPTASVPPVGSVPILATLTAVSALGEWLSVMLTEKRSLLVRD